MKSCGKMGLIYNAGAWCLLDINAPHIYDPRQLIYILEVISKFNWVLI